MPDSIYLTSEVKDKWIKTIPRLTHAQNKFCHLQVHIYAVVWSKLARGNGHKQQVLHEVHAHRRARVPWAAQAQNPGGSQHGERSIRFVFCQYSHVLYWQKYVKSTNQLPGKTKKNEIKRNQ